MNMQTPVKSEAIVRLEGVVKRFGEFTAVERADFEIGRGEFLAIMGSSGCGKTTTLRMLAGLEDPSEGNIYLDGERVNGKATWDRDTPMVWQSLAQGGAHCPGAQMAGQNADPRIRGSQYLAIVGWAAAARGLGPRAGDRAENPAAR
jgi:ABC-type taurine transport system ATPase subunit